MKLKDYKLSFGKVAKEYQKYRRTYDMRLYELLFSLLDKKAEGDKYSILDLGCGTGKSTEPIFTQIKRDEVSVTGVDPDEAMLEEARLSAKNKDLPITYLNASAEKLPFEENTFNAIITGAAFHWFATKRTLLKIKSVVKQNGVFFVFWVQYVDTSKPAIGEEIYEKYPWQGIPKKFRGIDYVKKCLTDAGFQRVADTTIRFTETKTVEEAVGLLTTNSSYALLNKDDQKNFMTEMMKVYLNAQLF